jgi:ribosomal protein S12 methylthiotransferase accessory factor
MTPREIKLDNSGLTEYATSLRERYQLRINAYDMTTDLGIPSVMVALRDETGKGPAISLGTKADLDPRNAVEGAIFEAIAVRLGTRRTYTLHGQRTDCAEEITDVISRNLFYYHGRDYADFMFQSEETVNLSDMPNLDTGNTKSNVDLLRNRLSSRQHEVYVADISPDQAKESGFYVLKTVIPTLHPFYLIENLPFHYIQRLMAISGASEVNRNPHPFP